MEENLPLDLAINRYLAFESESIPKVWRQFARKAILLTPGLVHIPNLYKKYYEIYVPFC